MRSLFWKGMLAFLAVIVVAVGTVALLVGRTTETEFRQYALLYGGIWNHSVQELATYYADHGSWEGLEVSPWTPPGMMGSGGRGRGGQGAGPVDLHYRVTDSAGEIVGDTAGQATGSATAEELAGGIAIQVDGETVGYLLPLTQSTTTLPLDAPQAQFLARIRTTLWVAALAALAVALLVGGFLFRSIIAPLRRVATASQAIARGDLSARAPAGGRDEVGRLALAFNQMAESLAAAEEARRNQSADIAHELRTPLTVVQGTLEAMLDGVYPPDQENLLAALSQVRTLARLVEDLRLLALADAGQIRLRKAPLNLRPFLHEVVEAHQPQAQQGGVTLLVETPRALPLVLADRDRLTQVLGNVLGNALRYVPEGSTVIVRVVDAGREVTVTVADNGPGVAPDDLHYLFKRFWRGDPARRRATGGSGLGLAIARHLVEAHGGRIWAEPTPGGGLSVIFSLPAAQISSSERLLA